jgi:hypothetical protein
VIPLWPVEACPHHAGMNHKSEPEPYGISVATVTGPVRLDWQFRSGVFALVRDSWIYFAASGWLLKQATSPAGVSIISWGEAPLYPALPSSPH